MDLRRNGNLSVEDSMRIDVIEGEVRKEYNIYIGEFIRLNKLSGVELLLTASCRNTIVSKVHDTFCRIALLENRLKNGLCPKNIHVDDGRIAKIVRQVLKRYGCEDDTVIEYNKFGLRIACIIPLNVLKSIFTIFNSWLWTRLSSLKKRPKGDVVFVDTFLFSNSIDEHGHYEDRYYTGHEKYLGEEERRALWFAPTLYGIKYPWEYLKLFKRIAKADRNFLIKEAWLTLFDYVYSLVFSIIIPFKVKAFPAYRELDVSAMIKHEVLSDIAALSLVRALCQYRFVRRLSKEKINICHVVNWLENQINDRALNLSFKKYYPEVLTHGYQGFMIIGSYASLQPTCYELEAGTLPNILHVINDRCLLSHRKVCDKLELRVSPAFRFSYLYDIEDRRSEDEMVVILSLPAAGMLNESIGIVRSYLQVADSLEGNVRAIVKVHPSYSPEKFIRLAVEFSDKRLEYTDKKIPELLEVASVLISTASSVCVEAVSVGVPVALYGSRFGVTMNPIPENISSKLWRIFYTPEQLLEIIFRAQDNKQRSSIVKDLFHPVTKEGTRALFTCL